MAHPTQPVPKSSAWEQAQGTVLHQLHLSNCIVVIEIWKPWDLIFLLLCMSHSCSICSCSFADKSLLYLAFSLFCLRWGHVESLWVCRGVQKRTKIYELQTKDRNSQAHNCHNNNTNQQEKKKS